MFKNKRKLTAKRLRLKQITLITVNAKKDPSKLDNRNSEYLKKVKYYFKYYINAIIHRYLLYSFTMNIDSANYFFVYHNLVLDAVEYFD